MSQFIITTSQPTKRRKTAVACLNCRKRHRKCMPIKNSDQCELCHKKSLECVWTKTTIGKNQEDSFDRFRQEEQIYSTVVARNYANSQQYVCSTHPIASFLSTDKFLCFDGDSFGLFNPWTNTQTIESSEDSNPDLTDYLRSQGAFVLPPITEQRELMQVFMDRIYLFFPVIEETDKLEEMPLLLLNAIFLAATRLTNPQSRDRCQQLFERCKLLELVENNKVVLIQSFLLMSIHEEGISGSSLSKEYITRACNLCGDIGLTTLSGSNGTVEDTQHRVYKKMYYGKSLLTRIFWVSYFCDRLSAATHARDMYYNMADVLIEEVSPEYDGLRVIVELATFIDRILCAHYRPPQGRSIDDKLHNDLLTWKTSINHQWVKLLYSYICILFLRCKLDPVTLDESVPKSLFEHLSKILKIDKVWFRFHVVGIHGLLHVTSLLHLLDEIQQQDIKHHAVELLELLKDNWWLAAAGLKLFQQNDK